MRIEDFRKLKLNITWRLLYLAFFKKLISGDDIVEYAAWLLEQGDDSLDVCELAGTDDSDTDYILSKLWDLTNQDKGNSDIEERKIRAVIVSEHLKEKNANYIDGLVELTELWMQFDFPEDCPHVVQGVGNTITPTEYYTEKNYNCLYEKNKSWLANEILYLQTNQ